MINHRLSLMMMRLVSPERYPVHPHRLSVSFLFLLPPSMLSLSLSWSFVAGPAAWWQFQHCQMPLLLLLFLLAHQRPLSLARCGAVPPESLPACASAWWYGILVVSALYGCYGPVHVCR